jgi:hypothetical protein
VLEIVSFEFAFHFLPIDVKDSLRKSNVNSISSSPFFSFAAARSAALFSRRLEK